MKNLNTSRKRVLWLLAVASMAPVAHAIDPNRAMSQYIRDHWGAEQGMPRGPVYAITQTADGYLWIATEAGLVRFDGMNFRLVRDNAGAPTSVLGLVADNENNLWVRLIGPNLLRYRNGVFETAQSKPGWPESNVAAMGRTNQGALLISSMERGAVTWRGGKFEMLATDTDLPRSPVISITQTPTGDIWVGTRDAGLFRLRGGKSTSFSKGLPDPKVNCLLRDGDSGLWIGTDNGIARWREIGVSSAGIPPSLSGFQALALARDRDGNVWIGTDSRGLLRFNSQGVVSLDEDGKGPGEAVTAVFEDREGNLWTGSASGIERLRDSVFVTYSTAESMPSKSNGPVYTDSRNRTWFAPVSGGLYWLAQQKVTPVSIAGIAGDIVYSIAGSGDELWIGRQRGGLTRLLPAGNGFVPKTFTQSDGLAENSVYAVHQNRDGTVWAGTLTGGASKFQNGRFTTYNTGNGLASNSVASILEAADGTMWFATPDGLSRYSGDRWHTFTTRDGLPANSINCLAEDLSGVLWVGTSDGLASFKSGRFQIAAGGPPSLRGPILGIAADQAGFLWTATSNNVLRVSRDTLLGGALRDNDIREYGLADGLHGIEGVRRHQSVAPDRFGRIWFSLNRGLSVIDPARVAISAPAIVHVQSISADGQIVGSTGDVRFPTPRQRIAFTFTGLSLSLPERIKFRYKLDGFDHGWSEPVTAREAVYTNLNAGPYRFRVVAANPDGLWNSNEAAVDFQIEPLVWQTWWFQLSALCGFALAALGVYRFRLQQLTGRLYLRFEERLQERTRIAKELHDTLLQGFMGASMQLHVAADRLPEDSPMKAPVDRILALMSEVIDEGRNAVRGLRLSDSHTEDLAAAFSRLPQELSGASTIDFRVIVEGQPRTLHPVVRDDVYRLGREALSNAFRHSQARRIEVHLEYTRKRLRVLVRDDGAGIESPVLESGTDTHHDLTGMRERAERLGAKLSVWSSPGAGTEIELSVPGHVAFAETTNGDKSE